MKKLLFMAATAALALSSCSSDEIVQAPETVEDGAVTFGAYVGRENRALDSQNVNLEGLKNEKGFGVFAYEQGATPFLSYLAGNTYPNFMYNQQVTWQVSPAEWTYTPLKYWPNNNGYVTFQAYAPYNADVTPVFNVAQNGVGIRYSNSENYDLLWGANSDKCYFDQQKPSVTDRTMFDFKHALSKLDFTVSYFSETTHEVETSSGAANGLEALASDTKIVVRSIKLVGDQPSTGVLSLYDGKWTIEKMDANIGWNTSDLTVDCTSSPGTTIGAEEDYGTLTPTVKAVKPAKSLMVIPSATPAHVEITYDVITTAPDPRNNSVVTNTVSSKDSNLYPSAHNFTGINLTAGKWTTVNIHIGLTSVKFDANVSNWDGSATVNLDVDLPNNGLPGVTAATVSSLNALDAAPTDYSTYFNTASGADQYMVLKYETDDWVVDASVTDQVIKVGTSWYAIKDGEGTLINPSSQTRYYKDGKYYTNEDCTENATAPASLAEGYYIIGGVVYKKA